MWQTKRSLEKEILDLGPSHYTQAEYDRCLQLLSRVNLWLGGFSATKRAFKKLHSTPKKILEIGCGGGYLCQRLHEWFPNAKIVGLDINPQAIQHAQSQSSNNNISFNLQDSIKLPYADKYFDVVTTMLVCHHLTDSELIDFFKECYRLASTAVIINDLHRHWLAYASFTLIAPVAFSSRLIWHDGRLSIRRAFRKKDWITLLKKAGFQENQIELKWNWAFRWTLTLKKP